MIGRREGLDGTIAFACRKRTGRWGERLGERGKKCPPKAKAVYVDTLMHVNSAIFYFSKGKNGFSV